MKKTYPYLINPYEGDININMGQRNYLDSTNDYVTQKQYVKITLLDWQENPIKELEGELTSGSMTKDGSSSVRRTCQFSASVNSGEANLEDTKYDFSINKKVFIEIGIKNYTNKYPEYPILWFPQGVFFIASASVNSSSNAAVTISLSLKDKMCGLNGDVGGKFPAPMVLDELDTQTPSGQYVTEKVLIYDIIQELVNHFGGEDLNNILIEDVPLRIPRIVRWLGDNPIYIHKISKNGEITYEIVESIENVPEEQKLEYIEYKKGQDIGYTLEKFVYMGELTAAPGETVCSVLDKIKQSLGNYEYFYDEFGIFHFREIKNYMNTSQGKNVLDSMTENDYLVEINSPKSLYNFSENNIISIGSNPRYENIKNDFIVQGLRKMTNSDISIPIRYHLAIDTKPKVGNSYYNLLLYQESGTNLLKACFPITCKSEKDLPMPGNFNLIYRIPVETSTAANDDTVDSGASESDTAIQHPKDKFLYWEDDIYKEVDARFYYHEQNNTSTTIRNQTQTDFYTPYITKDWRTELYLRGLMANRNGLSSIYIEENEFMPNTSTEEIPLWIKDINLFSSKGRVDIDYYFEELDAFWPQIYNLQTQQFYGEEGTDIAGLTAGNYYLDFIDSSSSVLGELSVSNIGRRSQMVVNNDINCLFEPEIPEIMFINIDDIEPEELKAVTQYCDQTGRAYFQVKAQFYSKLSTGGYNNAAYNEIKYQLYQYTNYQKGVNITAIPAFYLEPNTRVSIQEKSTNTYGDFMAANISIPFGPGGNMSVSCSEIFERF